MPKLLVVDDEVDICEVAKSYFKKRGIDVYTASNGADAIQIIKENNPDLVLMDFNMPGMTGAEALKSIREDLRMNTKVIMVTGMDSEIVINETKNYGILGCIHKPLVLDELEKTVRKELGM